MKLRIWLFIHDLISISTTGLCAEACGCGSGESHAIWPLTYRPDQAISTNVTQGSASHRNTSSLYLSNKYDCKLIITFHMHFKGAFCIPYSMGNCFQYFNEIILYQLISPRQNSHHFSDDIFKCISVNAEFCILIKISLNFVPKGSIDNNLALV